MSLSSMNRQSVLFLLSFLKKVFIDTVVFPLWSKASLREGNGPLF